MVQSSTKVFNAELGLMRNHVQRLTYFVLCFCINYSKISAFSIRSHIQSVGSIVEQLIIQQEKFAKRRFGVSKIRLDFPNICLRDNITDGISEKRYHEYVQTL